MTSSRRLSMHTAQAFLRLVPPATTEACRRSPGLRAIRTLKDEARTTIRLVAIGSARLVSKCYRGAASDTLRALFGQSRARREFDALRRMWMLRLPCVEPHSWGERRSAGFLRASTVRTKHVEGSDLATLLRTTPEPDRSRTRWSRRLGAMLARVHAAGCLWSTALPRNVIVSRTRDLRICDVPYATFHTRSIHACRVALIDLYTIVGSPSRRRDWSARERRSLVLAYAGGNRAVCRTVLAHLARRAPWHQRIARGLSRAMRRVPDLHLRLFGRGAPIS